MRAITVLIFTASLGLSSHALAGSDMAGSGYNLSQERGVAVYRGEHPESNFRAIAASQTAHQRREDKSALKAKLRKQESALAAQRRENATLAARVEKLEARKTSKPRRSRYGQSYFGNNRFFGANGFARNSNFSGANARGPVRRSRPQRRQHH